MVLIVCNVIPVHFNNFLLIQYEVWSFEVRIYVCSILIPFYVSLFVNKAETAGDKQSVCGAYYKELRHVTSFTHCVVLAEPACTFSVTVVKDKS